MKVPGKGTGTVTDMLAAAAPLIRLALEEDLGRTGPPWLPGDITGAACVPAGVLGRAWIEARQAGVLCGLPLVAEVFAQVRDDSPLSCQARKADGDHVTAGERIVELEGSLHAILAGERTALNFLQRLSGIATAAAELSSLTGGRPRVLDTRKTTPGWRVLEKLAVRTGGGHNHRMGLHDMYLIKENHIRAAGGIPAAVAAARRHRGGEHAGPPIEVEVENLAELEQALAAGADLIMLDNFTPDRLAAAVALTAGRVPLEVSGGIHAGTIQDYSRAGIDLVSVGALTHSCRVFDCSLLVERCTP